MILFFAKWILVFALEHKHNVHYHHFLSLTVYSYEEKMDILFFHCIAQWGQPLLLDAVAGIMGLVMDLKIDLLGCIRVPWKVKNQP